MALLPSSWIALLVTFLTAISWLKLIEKFAQSGRMSGQVSRKIVHIGTGPIFVLCWLLFPVEPQAKYLAALVPFAITLQFVLVGLGVIKDQATIQSLTRSGKRQEILKGPLYYGIVFVVITILFWYSTPIGIIAVMILSGGDGLADLVGKRIKSPRLPWSTKKSLAGSLAMLIGGWTFSILVIYIYTITGIFSLPLIYYIFPITVISLVATIIESLPLNDLDNITIPLVVIGLGYVLNLL